MRRPLVLAGAGVAVAVVAVVVVWFQPQTLLYDTTVDEALPAGTGAGAVPSTAPMADGDATPREGEAEPEMTETVTPPVDELTGTFEDRSHPTSGAVRVLTDGAGERILRIEDLATDNGPDLYVYLSAAPADAEADAFDDDAIDLGRLKGNRGDQNYAIPAATDLDRYTTVVIWCERFTVAFGVAALA